MSKNRLGNRVCEAVDQTDYKIGTLITWEIMSTDNAGPNIVENQGDCVLVYIFHLC